jgi:hypothetical protein
VVRNAAGSALSALSTVDPTAVLYPALVEVRQAQIGESLAKPSMTAPALHTSNVFASSRTWRKKVDKVVLWPLAPTDVLIYLMCRIGHDIPH